MSPQITCPHCGSTINLENRKGVDFDKITYALSKSPKTFTELLTITNLPRKTLSLRLKELCATGSVVRDGGYHLNSSIGSTNGIFCRKNGNGKMKQTILHIRKNVQWIPAALIICLVVVAFGSAMMISPPAPTQAPPTANFFYSPSTNIVAGRALAFDGALSNGPITNYYWDFGDGSPLAFGKIVVHAFAAGGMYTVTLRVTAHELTTSAQEIVYVSPAPQQEVLPIPPVYARIYVDSLVATINQDQIGQTMTLNVMISNVADLYTWEAGMTFNPAALKCIYATAPSNSATNGTTALSEGPFLQKGGYTLWVPAAVTEDGVIPCHGCTLTGATTPGVSGNGVLATVEFVVIGAGVSNIHLTNVTLLDSGGTAIPVFVAT